jgi:DeoR/GlpR family transcriptional regulator of sugar metabolism
MKERKLPAVFRHDLILKELDKKRFGTTIGLAKTLSVSEMTVRRDFDLLAEKGLLTRTHGGAVSLEKEGDPIVDLIEPEISERELRARDAKSAIARRAFAMISPQQTIALDIGSTTFALAGLLHDMNIKLFTSSLKIATALNETKAQVYVPCGRISGREPSITGSQAVNFFRGYYFDIAFIGVSGLPAEGPFDYSLEDSEIKRAVIERSRMTVALIDSSKFGRISVAHVSDLDAIDIVITDAPVPDPLQNALTSAGVRVETAPAQNQEGIRNDL